VLIFPAGATGDQKPARRVRGPNSGLNDPVGLAVDSTRRIYAANWGDTTVTTYGKGSRRKPSTEISGSYTGLNHPFGLALSP
jgi:hypothetical protein